MHEYENNVIYKLHNSNIQQKFSKFSFISGEKRSDFEKWNNFYMYSKKDHEKGDSFWSLSDQVQNLSALF